MKKSQMQIRGFTLIELLVVMVVISIISSITFKVWGMATRSANTAATINKLERLSHALEEYKSEYGQYPPVTSMRYVFEWTGGQEDWLRDHYFYENPDLVEPKHGLCSYLWPRKKGEHDPGDGSWLNDSDRDKSNKKRWFPFIEGIDSGSESFGGALQLTGEEGAPEGDAVMNYTNNYQTVRDAWDRDLKYASYPPYQSYKLWSAGPDGASGNADDIHRDRWDE